MASDDEEFWKEDAASIADREREQLEIARTGMRMPPPVARSIGASVMPNAMPERQSIMDGKATISGTAQVVITAAALMISCSCILYVRSCSNRMNAERTSNDHVFGTASQEDRKAIGSMFRNMTASKIVYKLETSGQRASLYVAPAFYGLNVDQKSLVLQVSYLHAFGLPKDTAKFSYPMSVHDSLTGQRIQTCDMEVFGVRWR